MAKLGNHHPLDEVIWRSLTSVHFAAPIDFTPRSFQSLLGLMERGDDRIALFTPEEILPPAPFSVLRRERVDQMVLVDTHACTSPIASGIELLGKRDIPAMMAPAEATKAGPFGPRTSGQVNGISSASPANNMTVMLNDRD